MDLWQSPKSNPQILIFLSAEPVTNKVLSYKDIVYYINL